MARQRHLPKTGRASCACRKKRGDVAIPGGLLLLRRAEVQNPLILTTKTGGSSIAKMSGFWQVCGGHRRAKRDQGTPNPPRWQTFDFLGFTHYWGRSRKGKRVIKRKTQGSRFTRALKKVAEWCRRNRHAPLGEQQRALTQKLQGHYAYYGITGNIRCLNSFCYEVRKVWHKWLSRRSRGQPMTWERFNSPLQRHPLPLPRIVHSCYVANL